MNFLTTSVWSEVDIINSVWLFKFGVANRCISDKKSIFQSQNEKYGQRILFHHDSWDSTKLLDLIVLHIIRG